MSSTIQNSSTSSPRLTPAAIGLDPASAIWTAPEAMALITLAPESNLRQSIVYPVAFSNAPLAMATAHEL